MFAALIGAIIWNVITWMFGIPSSSSHALVGGLVGAGVAKAGGVAIVWSGLRKTAAAIVLSPATGFGLALVLVLARHMDLRAQHAFRGGSDVSRAAVRLGVALLFGSRRQRCTEDDGNHCCSALFARLPRRRFLCAVLGGRRVKRNAPGTLFGGWRIVHTMGSKITRLNPMQGFCAETGGALTLFAATWLGIPVSTTHTITGAIIGVGAARRTSAVRWGIAGNIVIAWVITIPVTAGIAAVCYFLTGIASQAGG